MARRFCAGLCAVVLMAALVAFPLRARATAGALVAVGAAVTVSAFLMACGVYPYVSESGESFGEWAAQDLAALWQKFTESHATQVAYNSIKAFVVGNVLAYPRVTWDALREFADWIVAFFSVADNAEGVELGESVFVFPELVACGDSQELHDFGMVMGIQSGKPYRAMKYSRDRSDKVYVGAYRSEGVYFFELLSFDVSFGVWHGVVGSISSSTSSSATVQGVQFRSMRSSSCFLDSVSSDIPVYDSQMKMWSAFLGLSPDGYSFAGVTADTATVSTLPALSEGAEFGGLGVTGASSAGELSGIVEQGVVERQKPVVRPVTIEVGEGTQVDVGTGMVTAELPDTITITPDSVSVELSSSDYVIPSLSTVFPFSVPWDIMRVWQALDAEPRNPLDDFALTLDIPWLFGDSPPVVRFSLDAFPEAVATRMDEVVRMVRAFLLVIACLAWLVFVSQFIRF